MNIHRLRARHRQIIDVIFPVAVVHVLSIMSWMLATITTRRLRGDSFRADQLSGVFGWMSWDAGFYRQIAQNGYLSTEVESIRFFPLYPGLGRALSPLTAGNTDLILLLVAKVALVMALFGLYRLVSSETGSQSAAAAAVWVLVLFPGGFVLTWGYSEPLLLALSIWAFVALRSKHFGWAALLGLAAGLCRPVAVALVAAAAVEALRGISNTTFPEKIRRAVAVVAPLVGMTSFLIYSAIRHHDFWLPISVQDRFRNTSDPLSGILELPGQLLGADAFKSGLHVPFALAFIVLAAWLFWRLPASYGAFTVVVLAMTFSGDNLNSLERYAMSAFPLAIVIALVINRDERLRAGWLSITGGLFVGLCTLSLTGAYVP